MRIVFPIEAALSFVLATPIVQLIGRGCELARAASSRSLSGFATTDRSIGEVAARRLVRLEFDNRLRPKLHFEVRETTIRLLAEATIRLKAAGILSQAIEVIASRAVRQLLPVRPLSRWSSLTGR